MFHYFKLNFFKFCLVFYLFIASMCACVNIYTVLLSNEISKIICQFLKFVTYISGFSLSHEGVPLTNPCHCFLKLRVFHQMQFCCSVTSSKGLLL